MTKFFDRASELEQQQRDEALARQAAKQHTGGSLSHCEDCGDAIPEKRRQAVPGCRRCIHCQQRHEQGRA